MILVIDNDKGRIEAFRRALGKIFAVRNVQDAIHVLTEGKNFTRIYLDHDGVDGERIARWMAAREMQTHVPIYIHSSNTLAAFKMRDILAATHQVELVDWREVVGITDPA